VKKPKKKKKKKRKNKLASADSSTASVPPEDNVPLEDNTENRKNLKNKIKEKVEKVVKVKSTKGNIKVNQVFLDDEEDNLGSSKLPGNMETIKESTFENQDSKRDKHLGLGSNKYNQLNDDTSVVSSDDS